MTVMIMNIKTRELVFNDEAERVMHLYDSTGHPRSILVSVKIGEEYIFPVDTHTIHKVTTY